MSKAPRFHTRHNEIKTWEAADDLLRLKGHHQMEVQHAEAWMNQEIARVKAEYESQAKPHLESIADIDEFLKRFWLANRRELKAKSRTLNFGTIGQRSSRAVRILRGWKLKDAIHAVANSIYRNFLRQPEPVLDREQILQAPSAVLEKLRQCGVGIDERERFFAEPDLATISNTAAMKEAV